MKVYLSYCKHDYGQAMYAARALLEHTDFPHEKFYMYGSQYAPKVDASLVAEGINIVRCSNDKDSYPVGANFMFAGLMENLVNDPHEPVFLMEADGFVTCKDWYERIKAAHEECGTLVSGSMTTWVKPHHYNGNMVITPELSLKFPCLRRLTYDPWDCFHAELIAAHAADNPQIENPAKPNTKNHPTRWWIETWERLGKPAYMHGCKSYQMWEWLEREAPSW